MAASTAAPTDAGLASPAALTSTKRSSTGIASPVKRARLVGTSSNASARAMGGASDTLKEVGAARPLDILDLPLELLEDIWTALIAQCDSVKALRAAYTTTRQLCVYLRATVGADRFWQRNAGAIQDSVMTQLFIDSLEEEQPPFAPLAEMQCIAPFVRKYVFDSWELSVATLLDTLPLCTRLVSVYIHCCGFDPTTYTDLTVALANCLALAEVSIGNIEHATGLDAFVHMLSTRRLTRLEIEDSAVAPAGVVALSAALPNWNALTTLSLSGVQMNPAQWPALLTGISSCRALKHLNLCATGLDLSAVPHFNHALTKLAALEELDVSDNQELDDAGIGVSREPSDRVQQAL